MSILAPQSLDWVGCPDAIPLPTRVSAATASDPRVALVIGLLANEFFKHMAEDVKADQAAHSAFATGDSEADGVQFNGCTVEYETGQPVFRDSL